jgi:AraC-like DNA-binding protein
MDFPISEITDTRADLKQVFKNDLEYLCDSLHRGMGEQAKARALDIFFKNKLRQVRTFDDRAIPLTQYILQTNGTVRLQDLSKKLFIGERTAQRIIHNAVGVNYKFFARTVRLEHVRNLMAQQHTSLTGVAHRAGYFDQAHFIHDFREAFGESPGAYLKKQQRLVWNRVV